MRRAFVKFALFIFLPIVGAQELPLKTVELEWDAVENAFGYEIRLTPKSGGTPLIYKVIENKFVQDVPIGIYVLRIRSRHKDVEDHWSPWSDPINLEVLTKELSLLEPANEAVLTAGSDQREEVTFSWTSIDKARDYVLKIWSEETVDKPLTFVTRLNSQRLKLLPGRVYFWQVVFESATQVSYGQKAQTYMFSLQGKKLLKPSINPIATLSEVKELSWIRSPKAKTYGAKLLFRHLDETVWMPFKEETVNDTKWTFEKLKAGSYKLEVVAQAPRRANSETAIYEFAIKPTEAEVIQALKN